MAVMFSFDLLVFIIVTFAYLRMKSANPDFLFPLKGISFFVPPQEDDLAQLRAQKEASTKNFNKF